MPKSCPAASTRSTPKGDILKSTPLQSNCVVLTLRHNPAMHIKGSQATKAACFGRGLPASQPNHPAATPRSRPSDNVTASGNAA